MNTFTYFNRYFDRFALAANRLLEQSNDMLMSPEERDVVYDALLMDVLNGDTHITPRKIVNKLFQLFPPEDRGYSVQGAVAPNALPPAQPDDAYYSSADEGGRLHLTLSHIGKV